MTGGELEKQVSITEQLSEAFQLGSVLARIETGQQATSKVVDKIDGTVTGMSVDLGEVKVTLGRHDQRITALEERPSTNGVTKDEFVELKEEVRSGRLSWGKLGGLLGGLVALTGLLVFADRLIPGG